MATEGTYSSKPFLSKDGVDAENFRAEVLVTTGYGDVAQVKDSKAGKAKQVIFEVANNENTVSGWTRDPAVQKKIDYAVENKEPIHFRLEKRRKAHVDRRIPLIEVAPPRDMAAAKDNIDKSLAAVRLDSDEDWTISKDAVTRLEEDPVKVGGLVSAYDTPLSELQGSKPAPESKGNNWSGNGEPPAFVGRLKTGELNPGSNALNAPLSFYANILEVEREEGIEIEKEQRKEVARHLMLIANKLQVDIYAKKFNKEVPVDLTASSHARARGLIFETIRSFVPMNDFIFSDDDAYRKWKKQIYVIAYAMWEWAIDEAEPFVA